MKVFYSIALLFLIFQFNGWKANGYFVNKKLSEIDDSENSKVVHEFKIEYPSNKKRSVNSKDIQFPDEFSVRFNKFDREINAKFSKLNKNSKSQQLSNDNIYVIDENTGQPKLYQIDEENKIDHELYVQTDNQKGFATLIKNKNCDQNDNQFRMLGTIFISDDEDFVFDIVPVKDDSESISIKNRKYKKRSIGENSIYHTITKRSLGGSTNLNSAKTIDIKDDVKDYLVLPNPRNSNANQNNANRKKRAVNGNPVQAYVEYLVVTDVTIYNDHSRFINSTDPNLIYQHIRIYFAYLVNGINQRYANGFFGDQDLNLNVQLTNFLILTNNVNWTDPAVVGEVNNPTYNGKPVIVTRNALLAFTNYMNALTLPFTYDHAAGFFNKDLFSEDITASAASRSAVSGYASIGNICNSNRYSINEEQGGFLSVLTAAHELGHNLGSYHDGILGISSNCAITDNFIMAPSPSLINNQFNLYDFSSCSVSQIKSTILVGGSGIFAGLNVAATCLANVPTSQLNETTYVNYALPGQIWSPDDQCKMIYGNNASFCRDYSSNICTQLSCRRSPTDVCISYPGGPADGTICGSGQLCSFGSCVTSAAAPNVSCPFGDDIITQAMVGLTLPNNSSSITCASFLAYVQSINQSPNYYCQANILGSRCCQSCLKFNAMTCADSYFDCPSYKQLCKTATLGGQPLNLVCRRTCGDACTGSPLYCTSSSFLCQNGGTCVNQTNVNSSAFFGFTCQCPAGYSGELCEIRDPCLPNPCQNGGICNRIGSLGYLCNCTTGNSGRNCAPTTTTTTTTGTTTTTTTAAGTTTTTTTAAGTTTTTTTAAVTTTTTTTTTTLSNTTTTTTTSSTTTASSAACVNQNDQTCQFYLNLGVKCNSIAYINNLLFSQYCCKTCSATTTTTTVTTTTTTTTASTAANSSTTATTTTSGLTTTTCTNVNDQACQFYLNLGVKCNSASFINNVLFAVYCCKSCSTTTTTTAAVTTTATTTTTAASVTASTTTLGSCTNANDAACSYYLSVGVKCSASSFINSIPFTVYCCRACNQVVTTTQISTTTLTTTQGSAVCVDSQLSCAAWVNFCSILATYNPNPCRKTCKVC